MSTLRRVLATTVAGLVLGGASLGAQAPRPAQRHDGFNIGFGIGGANYDLKCDGCITTGVTDPWSGGFGGSAYFRVGGAISQQMILGGEVSGGAIVGANDRASSVGALLFTMQYYPGAYEGLHVTGALGPAGVALEDGNNRVEAFGYAVRAGIGYDFGLGKRFAITPYANVGRTMISQGSIETAGSPGAVTRLESKVLVQFGLGFNWY